MVRMNKKTMTFMGIVLSTALLSACSSMNGMDHSNMSGMNQSSTKSQAIPAAVTPVVSKAGNQTIKEFSLVAKSAEQEIKHGVKVPVWTYNGTVPGSQIRVTQGDRVKVHLKNELSVPITIHWHGYPVPNSMDGIPGMTQASIKPGESFTYDFVATTPGTYWYHSHYNSAVQVDKGLYGTFIVDPKDETNKPNRDYTLVLDEWMTDSNMNSHDMSNMNGQMNMGNHDMSTMSNMDHDQMMKQMYNVYTVNGKAGDLIEPLTVKKGEKVRLRLVNAGYLSHTLHLPNQPFQVVAIDGYSLASAPVIKDQLLRIGPGERYDVEFTADGATNWIMDSHDDTPYAADIRIPVMYEGNHTTPKSDSDKNLPIVDITNYGDAANRTFNEQTKFNKKYTLHLNSKVVNGNQEYMINDKIYPNTDPLTVSKGDQVKVTLINDGKSDHPMHLHGHVFQILSKNGKPVKDPVWKDTIVVRPGERYDIAFQANNTGNWMFHCHDLHHAAMGMMTEVEYQGYHSSIKPDPEDMKASE